MAHYKSDAEGKLHKYAGNSHKAYMPLGMIFASSVELDELNVKRLDGQSLTINGSYHEFCSWLISRRDKVPTCDIDTYASEMATYGQCGKFVINNTSIDRTSGDYTILAYSIKLPTITEFVASNNGGDEIGLAELDSVKKHNHQVYCNNGTGSGGTQSLNAYRADVATAGYFIHTTNTGSGTAEETRPKNIRYPFYVVVAQGVRLQALVDVEKKAETDASNLSNTDIENWQNKLGTKAIKLLWTNPNPSTNITTGTINLSSNDYDFLVFVVAYATYNLNNTQMLFTKKGGNVQSRFIDNAGYYNTSGDSILRLMRTLTYVNDKQYTIGATSARNWMSQSSAVDRSGFNDCSIPLYVLGVKL